MTPESAGAKGWSALGLLALVWGSAFAFIAVAVDTLPPSIIVLGRLSLAAAILTGLRNEAPAFVLNLSFDLRHGQRVRCASTTIAVRPRPARHLPSGDRKSVV